MTYREQIAGATVLTGGAPFDTGWINWGAINMPNVPQIGPLYSKVRRVGNTVTGRYEFQLAGPVTGTALMDMPYPFASDMHVYQAHKIGDVRSICQGVSWFSADLVVNQLSGPSRANLAGPDGAGSPWANSVPAAWKLGDVWCINYEYEAAPL